MSVGADHFEVSLNFSRKPERLTIPFDAITGFSDPSVPFGFKLEPRSTAEPARPAPSAAPAAAAKPALKGENGPKLVEPAKPAEAPAEGETKVVSIDAFRKK